MNTEKKTDLEMQTKMIQELEIVEESQNSTKFKLDLVVKIREMKSQVNDMREIAMKMKEMENNAEAAAQHGQCQDELMSSWVPIMPSNKKHRLHISIL